METRTEEQKIEEMMPRISLWVIGVATASGFTLSLIFDSAVPSFNKILIAGVLLFMVLSDFLAARFVNLPSLARADSPRSNLTIVGYAQSMFPAIIAVLGGIVVSESWLPLVCGAVAITCWLAVRDYLGPPPVSTS